MNKNSIVSLTLACAALAGVFYPASVTSPITGKLGGGVAIAQELSNTIQYYFAAEGLDAFKIYSPIMADNEFQKVTLKLYATNEKQVLDWFREEINNVG